MVHPSSSRPTITSPGQRTQIISILAFCTWLSFRLLFSTPYASFDAVDVDNQVETRVIKHTSSKGNNIAAASTTFSSPIDEASNLGLITLKQNSNQVIPVAEREREPPQQQQQQSQPQQQQQPQRQYNKQISSGTSGNSGGTIQHGATLEHPSLRNKMRRYREAKRAEEQLTPQADVLSPHFQQYVNSIKYVEVESGVEGVKRYAAVINSKRQQQQQQQTSTNEENSNNNYEPVTIRAWMTIVYSGNPIGNKASSELSNVIASSPFDSVLFEMPGTSWRNSAMKPMEFVLVNEPRLKAFAESNPDRHAFEEHFMSSQSSCISSGQDVSGGSSIPPTVCAFPNLGKDATLVSPLPQPGTNDATYSHLTSFIRDAPPEQISQFWKLSAKTYIDELKHKHERINEYVRTWFSTNGMGVAWLHLRLDSVPKYYSYEPFTKSGV